LNSLYAPIDIGISTIVTVHQKQIRRAEGRSGLLLCGIVFRTPDATDLKFPVKIVGYQLEIRLTRAQDKTPRLEFTLVVIFRADLVICHFLSFSINSSSVAPDVRIKVIIWLVMNKKISDSGVYFNKTDRLPG
jgi:hypothetical protein